MNEKDTVIGSVKKRRYLIARIQNVFLNIQNYECAFQIVSSLGVGATIFMSSLFTG